MVVGGDEGARYTWRGHHDGAIKSDKYLLMVYT